MMLMLIPHQMKAQANEKVNQSLDLLERKPQRAKIALTMLLDLTTKILDMQNAQVQAIERSQTRAEEMMLKLEIELRKIDEESRRDQEFFLRMA